MIALLLTASLLGAPEEIFSGPQRGEAAPPFKVLDVNGPNAGKEHDYLSEWKGAPTLLCFIHELTRPGAQLIRKLDEHGQRQKDALRTLFVSLTDDPQETERRLPVSVRAIGLKSLVGISLDGQEGPGAYGLNKKVLLTILALKDGKVTDNWAIVSPNETDFPRIQAALDRLTAPPLDTLEALRAEVLRLRSELTLLRSELDALRKDGAGRGMEAMRGPARREAAREAGRGDGAESKDKKELPGKAPSDEKLKEMVRGLIRPMATPEDIARTIEEIEGYVKDSAELKAQLVDAIVLVDHLGYGTDHSKAERKKLLEKHKK